MIYLFNSAFRPEYRRNILNTLYLPLGCTNEYRYGEQQIDPAFREEEKHLYFFKKNKVRSGEKVVIVYIDRHGTPEFIYHPIRRGILYSFAFTNEQIFFKVILQDYVYPNDIKSFQSTFINTIGKEKLPRKKGNNPDIPADGFFALKNSDTLNNHNSLLSDRAWVSAIENIAKTEIFHEAPNNKVIFLRTVIETKKNKILKPSTKNGDSLFNLKRDKDYNLTFIYRFPFQDTNQTANSIINASLGPEIIPKDFTQIPIEGRNNRKTISIKIKKDVKDLYGNISLSYPENPPPFGPISVLKYQINETWYFWIVMMVALAIFSFCTIIIGLDFSKFTILQPAQEFWQIFRNAIISNWVATKITASIFQTFILFILLRFTGKKIT